MCAWTCISEKLQRRFSRTDASWRREPTIIEAWRSSGRCSKAEVKKRADALPREGPNIKDIGLSWYDTNTFFHRRHVSSLKSRSAEERLSSNQVVRIRAALAEDIAAAGL